MLYLGMEIVTDLLGERWVYGYTVVEYQNDFEGIAARPERGEGYLRVSSIESACQVFIDDPKTKQESEAVQFTTLSGVNMVFLGAMSDFLDQMEGKIHD